jgi:hypothetical protein
LDDGVADDVPSLARFPVRVMMTNGSTYIHKSMAPTHINDRNTWRISIIKPSSCFKGFTILFQYTQSQIIINTLNYIAIIGNSTIHGMGMQLCTTQRDDVQHYTRLLNKVALTQCQQYVIPSQPTIITINQKSMA